MDAILSVTMLASLAMLAGAAFLWRRGGARKQAVLMLILAVVMIVNVLIWTVPGPNGAAPLGRAATGAR